MLCITIFQQSKLAFIRLKCFHVHAVLSFCTPWTIFYHLTTKKLINIWWSNFQTLFDMIKALYDIRIWMMANMIRYYNITWDVSNFLKYSDKEKKYPKHCSSTAHLSHDSINILLLIFLVESLQENQVKCKTLIWSRKYFVNNGRRIGKEKE